jgi:hypothetical protein
MLALDTLHHSVNIQPFLPWNCLELFGIVWNCLELFGIVWNCVQLFSFVTINQPCRYTIWRCAGYCGSMIDTVAPAAREEESLSVGSSNTQSMKHAKWKQEITFENPHDSHHQRGGAMGVDGHHVLHLSLSGLVSINQNFLVEQN